MRKALFTLSAILLVAPVCGGTVRLVNDSMYQLRGIVRGADGTYLGEMIMAPQKTVTWTDQYGQYGTYNGANAQAGQPDRSRSPYTVIWYCMDGSEFSTCDYVATGAIVTALTCNGQRVCRPPKAPQPIIPSTPSGG